MKRVAVAGRIHGGIVELRSAAGLVRLDLDETILDMLEMSRGIEAERARIVAEHSPNTPANIIQFKR